MNTISPTQFANAMLMAVTLLLLMGSRIAW
jgi:hypothetical protein